MMPLENARHEIFARSIVEGMSGREAYRAAGYETTTDEATDANASRLLRNDKVAARVAELQQAAASSALVSAEKVLAEMSKIAFANMADYLTVGSGGNPHLDWSKLTRDQAAALVEVTVDDFKAGRGDDARDVRRVRFKLADKRQALVDIGKCLGLFKDKVELSGPNRGPIQIEGRLPLSDIEAVRWIGRLLTKAAKEMPTPDEPPSPASCANEKPSVA